MIRLHRTEIRFLGKATPVVELQIETRQSIYIIRTWPDGRYMRIKNWLALTSPEEIGEKWKGPHAKLLDRVYEQVRSPIAAYLNNQPAAWDVLQQLVNGFNETAPK